MSMGTVLRSVDPSTGDLLATYVPHTDVELDAILADAVAAQDDWAARSLEDRLAPLAALAELLQADRDELAGLITAEMGKPITEALAEVDKCAAVCEHYVATAAEVLVETSHPFEGERALTVHEPLGVVLAIMPWNFPLWQVFRFAAPSLAAGNAALLKHAPTTTGCAMAIEERFHRAGFPAGVFQTLRIAEQQVPAVTERLIDDPAVAAVTLTGSERAGRAVAAIAGRELKPCVLELGGSDPFVVLDDADLDATVTAAVTGRFMNAGQSCISAKRLLVHERLAAAFTDRLVDAVAALRVGDPRDPATDVGPMARADLVENLRRQLEASTDQGAVLRLRHAATPSDGWYQPPVVLTEVRPGMPAFDEETFGPLAVVTSAPDDDTLVALANHTTYGLGATVWTTDLARGEALGRRIRSGSMFVNRVMASDPRLPFGGVDASGFGRELGAAGLTAFTNLRTIRIAAP